MTARTGLPQLSGQSSERSRGQALVEFALVTPLLFLLILGTIEAGRYIFFSEMLNNATRDGARLAIVRGADFAEFGGCASGPMPGERASLDIKVEGLDCDFVGDRVKEEVQKSSLSLAGLGDMFVHDPVWTSRGFDTPERDDGNTGHNAPGNYVTVFLDFTYRPLIETVVGVGILPDINIEAESTLVINY